LNYSWITDRLYIGTTPGVRDYDLLRALGVRLVLNMRFEHRPTPDAHDPPIKTLWLPVFDTPFIPIPVHVLWHGVRAALHTMAEGGAVYAHCAGGVHRGPAQAAAILIAQGHTPDSAIQLIKQHRPTANPEVWYIRRQILRFAKSLEALRLKDHHGI
jgi:protein-tyrosine phosphatase